MKILQRIEAALKAPGLAQSLIELRASDLQSLLLEVLRARSRRISPVELLDERRGLVTPAKLDARVFHQFDGAAYAAARAFEGLELSPVGPIGSNTVLGNIDQNSTLAALRSTEVLSDPTVPQALEAARRRRAARDRVVRLCASQRLIRMQPFDNPGFSRHFRLFSLVTAGRDTGSFRFEVESLREQIAVWLQLFRELTPLGYRFGAITVELSDSGVPDVLGVSRDDLAAQVRAHNHATASLLKDRALPLPEHTGDPRTLTALAGHPSLLRLTRAHESIVEPLKSDFPEARFRYHLHRLEGAGYYRGLCFRINVADPAGVELPLCDGGFTDWTQRLLSDNKERLLCSGIGGELVCKRFREG